MVNYWVAPGLVDPPEEEHEDKQTEKLERIALTVASYYGFDLPELKKPCRLRTHVLPRQIAMYFQYKALKPSKKKVSNWGKGWVDIGEYWGKNHATVIHSCNQVENMLHKKFGIQDVKDEVSELKRVLRWQKGIKV